MYDYIIKKIVALVLNLKFLGTDDNDGEYCYCSTVRISLLPNFKNRNVFNSIKQKKSVYFLQVMGFTLIPHDNRKISVKVHNKSGYQSLDYKAQNRFAIRYLCAQYTKAKLVRYKSKTEYNTISNFSLESVNGRWAMLR